MALQVKSTCINPPCKAVDPANPLALQVARLLALARRRGAPGGSAALASVLEAVAVFAAGSAAARAAVAAAPEGGRSSLQASGAAQCCSIIPLYGIMFKLSGGILVAHIGRRTPRVVSHVCTIPGCQAAEELRAGPESISETGCLTSFRR